MQVFLQKKIIILILFYNSTVFESSRSVVLGILHKASFPSAPGRLLLCSHLRHTKNIPRTGYMGQLHG